MKRFRRAPAGVAASANTLAPIFKAPDLKLRKFEISNSSTGASHPAPRDPHVPAWLARVNGWLADVVDFCYPGLCPGCRGFAPPDSALCQTCSAQLDRLANAPVCGLCGVSLAYRDAPCPHCLNRGVPHYERVVRLCSFDSPVNSLIHQFKYHGRWALGELLADRALKESRVRQLLEQSDCLLPVPLHPLRQLSRGFNQAQIVAERLARAIELPVVCAAARQRNTQTQTHLHSRAKRMANLKNAFRLTREQDIAGRHVAVIDDVMTTGATLQTLARALRPAKPASLSVLIVAVADATRNFKGSTLT